MSSYLSHGLVLQEQQALAGHQQLVWMEVQLANRTSTPGVHLTTTKPRQLGRVHFLRLLERD